MDKYIINYTTLNKKGGVMYLTPINESLTLNNTEVTFDYGDGSIEEATSVYTVDGNNILSSSHNFDYPGVYTVRMVLRDCNNNAIIIK